MGSRGIHKHQPRTPGQLLERRHVRDRRKGDPRRVKPYPTLYTHDPKDRRSQYRRADDQRSDPKETGAHIDLEA